VIIPEKEYKGLDPCPDDALMEVAKEIYEELCAHVNSLLTHTYLNRLIDEIDELEKEMKAQEIP